MGAVQGGCGELRGWCCLLVALGRCVGSPPPGHPRLGGLLSSLRKSIAIDRKEMATDIGWLMWPRTACRGRTFDRGVAITTEGRSVRARRIPVSVALALLLVSVTVAAGCGQQRAGTAPSPTPRPTPCLLYTSDAADDLLCVDLGGRRIIKKKKINNKELQPRK